MRISVAWFLSRGTLSDTPEIVDTYRSFLVSGIVVARGLRKILSDPRAARVHAERHVFRGEHHERAGDERGIPFGTYKKGFIHDRIVMTPGAAVAAEDARRSVGGRARRR